MRQAMKIMLTEKDPLRLSDDRKTFADYDVKMDAHIILRDIGPQIGYRNVSVCHCRIFTYRCLCWSMLDLSLSCFFLPCDLLSFMDLAMNRFLDLPSRFAATVSLEVADHP